MTWTKKWKKFIGKTAVSSAQMRIWKQQITLRFEFYQEDLKTIRRKKNIILFLCFCLDLLFPSAFDGNSKTNDELNVLKNFHFLGLH